MLVLCAHMNHEDTVQAASPRCDLGSCLPGVYDSTALKHAASIEADSAQHLLFTNQSPAMVLHMACACNSEAGVAALFQATGAAALDDPEVLGGQFTMAASRGYSGIVRQFLALTGDRAINVHRSDDFAFRMACDHGHVQVVRDLLALTGDRRIATGLIQAHALFTAAKTGEVEILRELLALKGDRFVDVHVNYEGPFRCACENGQEEVVRELLALTGERLVDVHVDNDFPIRMACEGGHVEVVRELLALTGDRAVNVRAVDEYALRQSLRSVNMQVLLLLLQSAQHETPLWMYVGHLLQKLVLCDFGPAQASCDVMSLCAVGDAEGADEEGVGGGISREQVIAQHVLMHALDSALSTSSHDPDSTQVVRLTVNQYLAHGACLPAAQHIAMRAFLRNIAAQEDKRGLPACFQLVAAAYQDAVWRGVCVPVAAIGQGHTQAAPPQLFTCEADLARALQRTGRRAPVLFRHQRRAQRP